MTEHVLVWHPKVPRRRPGRAVDEPLRLIGMPTGLVRPARQALAADQLTAAARAVIDAGARGARSAGSSRRTCRRRASACSGLDETDKATSPTSSAKATSGRRSASAMPSAASSSPCWPASGASSPARPTAPATSGSRSARCRSRSCSAAAELPRAQIEIPDADAAGRDECARAAARAAGALARLPARRGEPRHQFHAAAADRGRRAGAHDGARPGTAGDPLGRLRQLARVRDGPASRLGRAVHQRHGQRDPRHARGGRRAGVGARRARGLRGFGGASRARSSRRSRHEPAVRRQLRAATARRSRTTRGSSAASAGGCTTRRSATRRRRSPPGTPFRLLPDTWHCPNCAADKSKFMVIGSATLRADDAVQNLANAYRRAALKVKGMPIYNPTLAVEAVGFRAARRPPGRRDRHALVHEPAVLPSAGDLATWAAGGTVAPGVSVGRLRLRWCSDLQDFGPDRHVLVVLDDDANSPTTRRRRWPPRRWPMRCSSPSTPAPAPTVSRRQLLGG